MKVEVCENVCTTCPWRVENAHQLQKETIKHMIESEIISPCHQKQARVDGCTETEGVEIYAADRDANNKPFMVCRGIAIARAKMNRKHKNFMLHMLDAKVKLGDDLDREDIVDMSYIYGETNEKD